MSMGNLVVPGFCIFYLHNTSLSAEERLQVFKPTDIPRHLHGHVRHMAEDVRVVCPGVAGGTCRYTAPRSLDELWEHIDKVHYEDIVFAKGLGVGKEGHNSRRKEGVKYT